MRETSFLSLLGLSMNDDGATRRREKEHLGARTKDKRSTEYYVLYSR